MKFEIKDLEEGGYWLYEKSDDTLIVVGDIVLYKERKKNQSNYYQNENKFNYHGIKNALCGETKNSKKGYVFGKTFSPKRIQVIQMETIEQQQRERIEKERKRLMEEREKERQLEREEKLFQIKEEHRKRRQQYFEEKQMGLIGAPKVINS